MTNTKPMTLSDIMNACGISTNSSSYLARSIEYGDITAEKLFNLYSKCKKNLEGGEQKAEVLRTMIMDLPTLKPTFFVEFIVRLPVAAAGGEWWWDKQEWLRHYSGYYNQDLLTMPICPTSERIKQQFTEMLSR